MTEPKGPNDPRWWTEERRQAARDWWSAEKRLEMALKKKANPTGSHSKEWWTPARRAAHAELKRRQAAKVTLEEAFAAVDAWRRRWGR